MDSVARLGRLGETIDRIEAATAAAIERRRGHPTLGAVPAEAASGGAPVFAAGVGYVQRVDVAALQAFAEQAGVRARVAALPGTLATPDRPLAHVTRDGSAAPFDERSVISAFRLGEPGSSTMTQIRPDRARGDRRPGTVAGGERPGHRHRHHGPAGAPPPAME